MSGPEADGKLEFRVPGKRACKRPNRNDNGGGRGGVLSENSPHPTSHPNACFEVSKLLSDIG